MLHSTFDLISLAATASNSLLAFCFCNLIIAVLLVSSSKPNSDIDQESPSPSLGVEHRKIKSVMDDRIESYSSSSNSCKTNEVSKEDVKGEALINNSVEESPDHEEEEEEEESQSEEDDELRKRFEEFIDKVNRGWKAEKLRMNASGY